MDKDGVSVCAVVGFKLLRSSRYGSFCAVMTILLVFLLSWMDEKLIKRALLINITSRNCPIKLLLQFCLFNKVKFLRKELTKNILFVFFFGCWLGDHRDVLEKTNMCFSFCSRFFWAKSQKIFPPILIFSPGFYENTEVNQTTSHEDV